MPRTKLQNKVDGVQPTKGIPKNLEVVKQQEFGWKFNAKKGGRIPKVLQGVFLTDKDACAAAERYYNNR